MPSSQVLENLKSKDKKVVADEELKSSRINWLGLVYDWSRYFLDLKIKFQEIKNYRHFRSFRLKRTGNTILIKGRNGIYPTTRGGVLV